MNTQISRLALFTLLLSSSTLSAQGAKNKRSELTLVGRHSLQGQLHNRAYTGSLTIDKHGGYRLKRHFQNGATSAESGAVGFQSSFVIFGGRAYRISDHKGRYRLIYEHKGHRELVDIRQRLRSRLQLASELLKRKGAVNWLLRHNQGVVDPRKGFEIYRSKQPDPEFLKGFCKQAKIRTIISLNGEQDKLFEVKGRKQRVPLKSVIQSLGFKHYCFRLGAKRAPSQKQLTAIFKLLRDDSLKPILIHCNGGSDRTGLVSALYQYEYLGLSKDKARAGMRKHLWMATGGTEIQGLVFDFYKKGQLREWLKAGKAPKRARLY